MQICEKCKKETFVIYVTRNGRVCFECYEKAMEERRKNAKYKIFDYVRSRSD